MNEYETLKAEIEALKGQIPEYEKGCLGRSNS
jgi:hypothetical protein